MSRGTWLKRFRGTRNMGQQDQGRTSPYHTSSMTKDTMMEIIVYLANSGFDPGIVQLRLFKGYIYI